MTTGRSDLIDIAGEVRAETEKAYLFFDGEWGKTVWLSKSQCEWDGETMTMPEWLAAEKELI